MNDLLIRYAANPKDAMLNFELAAAYKEVKHYAGACSYFLRCAEWADSGTHYELIYESLIQISICFKELGNREWSEEGWLIHAIAFHPQRPEAYWLLSQLYERQKKWQECYLYAVLGLNHSDYNDTERGYDTTLLLDIGYEGRQVLEFQKAVAAWWIGRLKECRNIMLTMPDKYQLSEKYIQAIQSNINSIGVGPRTFRMYSKNDYDRFRFKFPGLETIERNYSQVFQDMFVMGVLDGKRNGFYLEIGSSDPFHVNNTWLLESQFGWKGISIDVNEKDVERFVKQRKNTCICRDATTINYSQFLKGLGAPKDIDYLQLDCEPPATTYKILTSIPFEEYRFAVITFEHDYFVDASRKYRELSRQFLHAHGYVLFAGNISSDDNSPFEDWWVNTELVDMDWIQNMQRFNDHIIKAEKYMLRE